MDRQEQNETAIERLVPDDDFWQFFGGIVMAKVKGVNDLTKAQEIIEANGLWDVITRADVLEHHDWSDINLTFKGPGIQDSMTRETLAFTGSLWCGDVEVCGVRNDGGGGCMMTDPPHDCQEREDWRKLERRVNVWAICHGEQLSHDFEHLSQVVLGLLCGEFLVREGKLIVLGEDRCAYCGNNCPNEGTDSKYLCDGYAGDIDNLYADADEGFDNTLRVLQQMRDSGDAQAKAIVELLDDCDITKLDEIVGVAEEFLGWAAALLAAINDDNPQANDGGMRLAKTPSYRSLAMACLTKMTTEQLGCHATYVTPDDEGEAFQVSLGTVDAGNGVLDDNHPILFIDYGVIPQIR